MTTWTSILLGSLCWCTAALNSGAETIDHLNPRWRGRPWTANALKLPALAYQRALFPLVTQGPATIALPDEPFILRLWVLHKDDHAEEPLMVLWGRVADAKPTPMASLHLRRGRLVWVCKVNATGDSLFDARAPVELETDEIPAGLWTSADLLVNPKAFQQTFGWNRTANEPEDPARRSKSGRMHMARQLTPAPWEFDRLELQPMRNIWLGHLELLPADAPPLALNLNIARARP